MKDAQKVSPPQAQVCGYCWKRIYRQKNGEWYHLRNGSTSCRPGVGSDRRAFPAGRRR